MAEAQPMTDAERRKLRILIDVERARRERKTREEEMAAKRKRAPKLVVLPEAIPTKVAMPKGYTRERIGTVKSAANYRHQMQAAETCTKHARVCSPQVRFQQPRAEVKAWGEGSPGWWTLQDARENALRRKARKV